MYTAVDLQAQHAGTFLPVAAPAIAYTRTTRRSSIERATDPIDDFFGYPTVPSSTRESRHDRRISDVPPSYAETQPAPAYSLRADPITLAMYLFKFGFLFPPFWIMGAIILMSPLRAPDASGPASWMPEKTEAERQEIINTMRRVELKWAKRCLVALLVFICAGVAVGIAVWQVLK